MRLFLLLFFYISCVFSADYDCIVIGSSPFSLFEALYQYHTGKTVLILEEAKNCGGAWKSIEVCGIPNADLGCHNIGNDMTLKAFLEEYAGCTIVSLDQPSTTFEDKRGPNGWYFSNGCHELIDNLMKLIGVTDIEVQNELRAESVSIDSVNQEAIIQTDYRNFSTKKLIVTPMSCLAVNCSSAKKRNYGRSKHYHLYMLINDPTPFRFTYRAGCTTGMSRMMNLTHFVGLSGTDQQLIAIQTYNAQHYDSAQIFLDAMKGNNLIDRSATLLETDTYTYESGVFEQGLIRQLEAEHIVEVLQTGHLQNLVRYVPRWQEALKQFDI